MSILKSFSLAAFLSIAAPNSLFAASAAAGPAAKVNFVEAETFNEKYLVLIGSSATALRLAKEGLLHAGNPGRYKENLLLFYSSIEKHIGWSDDIAQDNLFILHKQQLRHQDPRYGNSNSSALDAAAEIAFDSLEPNPHLPLKNIAAAIFQKYSLRRESEEVVAEEIGEALALAAWQALLSYMPKIETQIVTEMRRDVYVKLHRP